MTNPTISYTKRVKPQVVQELSLDRCLITSSLLRKQVTWNNVNTSLDTQDIPFIRQHSDYMRRNKQPSTNTSLIGLAVCMTTAVVSLANRLSNITQELTFTRKYDV